MCVVSDICLVCVVSGVVVVDRLSDEYDVCDGLREGSVLSPVLYAIHMDGIVDCLQGCGGISVGGNAGFRCRVLLYVDDIILVSENAADLQRMLTLCQDYADDHSFHFSLKKSQVVVFGPDVDFPASWSLMVKVMV